jgi:hypothetical protein
LPIQGTCSGPNPYWLFPAKSDSPPTWELSTSKGPNPGSNSANFYDGTYGYASTGLTAYNSSYDYLTDVGAYPNSLGPYGTLDQGGNVWQWTEALMGPYRVLRGGSWYSNSSYLASSYRFYTPWVEGYYMGFRLASVGVPEPGSLALLLAGAIVLLAYAWRRRK